MNEELQMKCIIGLGNPGKKYEKTRHNIGFMAMDELAKRHGFDFDKSKFDCVYHLGFIDPEQTLVIYDDLDLPPGKIRLRGKGGHGGHNGIRSLIDHLGTREFKRVRLGIGRPEDATSVVNYVLQPFSKREIENIESAIQRAADACEMWMQESFDKTMNEFNS